MKRPHRISCPYCDVELEHLGAKHFQEGLFGWSLGSQQLDLYRCPNCGKIEFFAPEDASKPEPEDPEYRSWTCQCGCVNENEADFCLECHDPRRYSA